MGFFSFIKAFFIGVFTSSGTTEKLPAITNFDETKFVGTWYEYVRYDHWFERDLLNVFTIYTKESDDTIKVVNIGKKNGVEKTIVGKARRKNVDKPNDGNLEVSFFGPFYSDYKIVYVDEQFETMIVTGKTYDYFWILSKNKNMSSVEFTKVINKAIAMGFDVKKMIISEDF